MLKSQQLIKNVAGNMSSNEEGKGLFASSIKKTASPTIKSKNSVSHSKVSLPLTRFPQPDFIEPEMQVNRESTRTPVEPPGSMIQRGMIELEEDPSRADEATPEGSVDMN